MKTGKGADDLADIGSDVMRGGKPLSEAADSASNVERAVGNAAEDAAAEAPSSGRMKGIPLAIEVTKDSAGRITSSSATIRPENLYGGTGTTEAARAMSRPDDAGHIFARLLGGRGGASSNNIFAQLPGINRGSFRDHEKWVAAQVQAGKDVRVKVTLIYGDATTTRPSSIRYDVTVDGFTQSQRFPND